METHYRYLIPLLILTNLITLTQVIWMPKLLSVNHISQGRKYKLIQKIQVGKSEGYGLQGFVLFSSYRLTESRFVALGLSALAQRQALAATTHHCKWASGERIIHGRVNVKYPGETHGRTYQVALLFCQLSGAVHANESGELTVLLEDVEVPVYSHFSGNHSVEVNSQPSMGNLSLCSSAMFGEFHTGRLKEFLEYYRVIHGVDMFHLYNWDGIDGPTMALLDEYVHLGMVSITDVTPIGDFDCWWYGQVLTMNDCLYRSYNSAKWVIYVDFDEFLYVKDPPHSIQPYLQQQQQQKERHEVKQLGWLSFGSEYWHTKECSRSVISMEQQCGCKMWELEKVVFRQPLIHCVAPEQFPNRSLCTGKDGHRKLIASPRNVVMVGIHKVVEVVKGSTGFDMDASIGHVKHFRAYNVRRLMVCMQFVGDTDWIPPSWYRDFSMMKVAKIARIKSSESNLSYLVEKKGNEEG